MEPSGDINCGPGSPQFTHSTISPVIPHILVLGFLNVASPLRGSLNIYLISSQKLYNYLMVPLLASLVFPFW